jgi:hypothetical protein
LTPVRVKTNPEFCPKTEKPLVKNGYYTEYYIIFEPLNENYSK